jgi:ankyrin repeat protein
MLLMFDDLLKTLTDSPKNKLTRQYVNGKWKYHQEENTAPQPKGQVADHAKGLENLILNNDNEGLQHSLSVNPSVHSESLEDGSKPLHLATQRGNKQAVQHLIQAGADPNVQDTEGSTPLHHAVHYNNSEDHSMFDHLIDHGADINLENHRGETPLHSAVLRGDSYATQKLLDLGADPHASKEMPLTHTAFYSSGPDTVHRLLDAGVDIDAQDKDGATVLHHSAGHDREGLTRGLLQRGANPNIKDNAGETPKDWAEKYTNPDNVKELTEDKAPEQQLRQYSFSNLAKGLGFGAPKADHTYVSRHFKGEDQGFGYNYQPPKPRKIAKPKEKAPAKPPQGFTLPEGGLSGASLREYKFPV